MEANEGEIEFSTSANARRTAFEFDTMRRPPAFRSDLAKIIGNERIDPSRGRERFIASKTLLRGLTTCDKPIEVSSFDWPLTVQRSRGAWRSGREAVAPSDPRLSLRQACILELSGCRGADLSRTRSFKHRMSLRHRWGWRSNGGGTYGRATQHLKFVKREFLSPNDCQDKSRSSVHNHNQRSSQPT